MNLTGIVEMDIIRVYERPKWTSTLETAPGRHVTVPAASTAVITTARTLPIHHTELTVLSWN